MSGGPTACAGCLRRAWLLAELAGHLDVDRSRIEAVLALGDAELIDAVAGRRRDRARAGLSAFEPSDALAALQSRRLSAICRCHPSYPAPLVELSCAPAVIHVAGDPDRLAAVCAAEPVAIVGARRPSAYGAQVARSLARSLSSAGVPVISGLALGIDSAAHEGALAAAGTTVAVLPAGADRAYPRANRALYRRVLAAGAAVSELPPGVSARRWMFPARNRIIAALARMTVVVEAEQQSGALLTAGHARELGRALGAVPGRVTSPQAAGCLSLLAEGAQVVRGAEDVLEVLYGADRPPPAADPRPGLEPRERALLEAVGTETDTAAALARVGLSPETGLATLAWLELCGHVRREPGGRYVVIP